MDDDTLAGIKRAYNAAPSAELAEVLIQAYIEREEIEIGADFYHQASGSFPQLVRHDWAALCQPRGRDRRRIRRAAR